MGSVGQRLRRVWSRVAWPVPWAFKAAFKRYGMRAPEVMLTILAKNSLPMKRPWAVTPFGARTFAAWARSRKRLPPVSVDTLYCASNGNHDLHGGCAAFRLSTRASILGSGPYCRRHAQRICSIQDVYTMDTFVRMISFLS